MNPASSASETAGPTDPDALRQRAARCRFVLVETSHPGNVGSTARALKTMGFGEGGSFVLVRPREADAQTHADAIAMASGADDVLAGARVVGDIGEALAGASLTIALTARPREFGPRRIGPRRHRPLVPPRSAARPGLPRAQGARALHGLDAAPPPRRRAPRSRAASRRLPPRRARNKSS